MRLIAVNGSPRKKWNTAQLLSQVVEGAKTAGMDTKLIHLYDLEFKGCISCFSCKRIGGKSYGRCAMRDDLTPILEAIHNADALVLGSPIYLLSETGEMRSFMERLIFQYLRYTEPFSTMFQRRIRTALLYTMNLPEERAQAMGLPSHLSTTKMAMEMMFGACDVLCSYDTLQFSDYSAYENEHFDPAAKKCRYEEVFPHDLAKAHEIGCRLVEPPPAC